MTGKLAALGAAAVLAAPGSTIVLKAVPPFSEAKLRATVQILRARLMGLGATATVTRGPGSRVIEIKATGLADPARAARILIAPGRLEFYDLEADLVPPSIGSDGYPVAHTQRLRARKGTVLVTFGPLEVVCPGVPAPPDRTYYYLFKRNLAEGIPEMTGSDLKLSGTRQDFDPTTNEPVVLMQFTIKGRKKFKEVTRAEALRGKKRGALQHFAIMLDRELKSFPSIDYNQYPDGIDPINGAQITGIRSIGKARELAALLGAGPLPVRLVVVRSGQV